MPLCLTRLSYSLSSLMLPPAAEQSPLSSMKWVLELSRFHLDYKN